jgi:hypothetical protein
MLAEQVRKREKEKLKQAQVIKDVVDGFIFPAYEQLRLTLEKITACALCESTADAQDGPNGAVPASSESLRSAGLFPGDQGANELDANGRQAREEHVSEYWGFQGMSVLRMHADKVA